MRKFLVGAVTVAAFAAAMTVANVDPAAAQVAGAGAAATLAAPDSLITSVQWRRGGWRGGPGWRGGCGWGGCGRGWWVPGAIVGGALVGGAIAAGAAGPYPAYGYPAPGYPVAGPGGGDAVAYCMQRFHSYDPRSQSYLGNDGYRHSCP